MNKVAVVAALLIASANLAVAQPAPPPAPGATPATVIIIDPGSAAPVGAPPSATAPGVAPVGPVGPGGAAPTNEPWSDVSHINGTPVPIGSRNEYLYKFRRTVISANPLAWMFEIYGVSLSVALNDNVAVHGDVTFYSFSNSDEVELSLGVPVYLRRTYQGPFCEPGVLTRTDDGGNLTGPQVLLGWQWTYDSGWSLAIAGGAGRYLSGTPSGDAELFPNGYLRMGYAF